MFRTLHSDEVGVVDSQGVSVGAVIVSAAVAVVGDGGKGTPSGLGVGEVGLGVVPSRYPETPRRSAAI